jgi:hypothetical protein
MSDQFSEPGYRRGEMQPPDGDVPFEIKPRRTKTGGNRRRQSFTCGPAEKATSYDVG